MEVLILIGIVILIIWLRKKFKMPVTGCVSLVTGGVKSGKTTFALSLARSVHIRALRRTRFINFFRKIFGKELLEEPLFYSNVKHPFPFVPVTKELLLRKARFVYGSVVYLSEASLLADSMCWKDGELNEALMLFNKLFGHETKGGYLIYDTQSISDLHYSIERCLSEYFYVHHTVKWIPFFILSFVRECRYSADGSSLNVFQDDVEETLRPVIIPKKRWKEFDCYCYSAMTDHLPVVNKEECFTDLTVKNPLRFKNLFPNAYNKGSRNNEKT